MRGVQTAPLRATLQFLACSLALLAAAARAEDPSSDSTFVGWQGESFDKAAVFGQGGSGGEAERWIETISWTPRAFIYHNLLTPDEADALILQAAPHMKRSTVVGGEKNSGVVDNIRTSYGTFLDRLSSPAVETLEKKLANWTQLPIINQEDIQILRYDYGQKYGAHYDALGRLCTVLVYLAEPEEGGETAFPKTSSDDWADESQKEYEKDFSACAKGHVAFKPRKGDALLFYSIKPDGTSTDGKAMHTGCPLIRGIKWTATVWIHPTPFRPGQFHKEFERLRSTGQYTRLVSTDPHDPGICSDTHEKCAHWAAAGECDKNPSYMKGGQSSGACRLSCLTCKKCATGDRACYVANREAAGYLDLSGEVMKLTGQPLPERNGAPAAP